MAELAEALAKSLQKLGVRYVFGIPGGPSIPYMEALKKNGIEFVTVANEQSAGMMADVFGRLTGIPGVCHATFGPGATNLSTGVGEGLLDRSPLLALTTEFEKKDFGRKCQMNVDHQKIFEPITKWTTSLSPENFNEVMTKAVDIATGEMPGPVHIGLPLHIEKDQVELVATDPAAQKKVLSLPDQASLEAARALLEKAKKPILALGLTAYRYGLHDELKAFVDQNNIPVVLTPMAKGLVAQDHPWYAGVLFHARCDYVANIYREADLVIGFGYDSVEFNYEAWMPIVPLLHFDTEPVDITPEYDQVCQVLGSLTHAIAYLNGLSLPIYDWQAEQVADNKKKLFEALVPQTETFNPAHAIQVIQAGLPEDSILTCDVGAHLHLLGQLWEVDPSGYLLMTNGWSTMGFGIPAAIGAKLCLPERTVVCITGDGGFVMNCGELIVARRLGINVVIVVFVDNEYSLIKVKQEWKGVDQYATSVHEGEYFEAERFLGVPVLKARDKDEMKSALEKAVTLSGPAIIEATVDGSIYSDLIIRNYK